MKILLENMIDQRVSKFNSTPQIKSYQTQMSWEKNSCILWDDNSIKLKINVKINYKNYINTLRMKKIFLIIAVINELEFKEQ